MLDSLLATRYDEFIRNKIKKTYRLTIWRLQCFCETPFRYRSDVVLKEYKDYGKRKIQCNGHDMFRLLYTRRARRQ